MPSITPTSLCNNFNQAIGSKDTEKMIQSLNEIALHYKENEAQWEASHQNKVFYSIFNANHTRMVQPVLERLFRIATKAFSPSCDLLGKVFEHMQYNSDNIRLLVGYGVRSEHIKNDKVRSSLLGTCLGLNFTDENAKNVAILCPQILSRHDGVGSKAFFEGLMADAGPWANENFQQRLKSLPVLFDFSEKQMPALQAGCHQGLTERFFVFHRNLFADMPKVFNILLDMNWIEPTDYLEKLKQTVENGRAHDVHWQVCKMIFDKNELQKKTLSASVSHRSGPRL